MYRLVSCQLKSMYMYPDLSFYRIATIQNIRPYFDNYKCLHHVSIHSTIVLKYFYMIPQYYPLSLQVNFPIPCFLLFLKSPSYLSPFAKIYFPLPYLIPSTQSPLYWSPFGYWAYPLPVQSLDDFPGSFSPYLVNWKGAPPYYQAIDIYYKLQIFKNNKNQNFKYNYFFKLIQIKYSLKQIENQKQQKRGKIVFSSKFNLFTYNYILILQTMQPESIDKQINTQPRRKLEILAVSDTHGSNKCIEQAVQGKSGDIFIHAGDFTKRGTEESFRAFFELLDKINFRYKIVIAGNHQIMLDNGTMDQNKRNKHLLKYPCNLTRAQIIAQLKKRCIYLQHQAIQIEGVKIFGSPYTLLYCNTAFQYKPELDDVLWSKVPKQVDILVTHCPPFGILDKANSNKNGGSKALQAISAHRKPKYHIFGHIHEGKGIQKIGQTLYINVAKQPTRLQI